MGDCERKFICEVRNSITRTADIDQLARDVLKAGGKAFPPSDLPRGRLRKYLNNIAKEPFVNLRDVRPAQKDILGTEYFFEGPCFQSALLATVILHQARTDDWNGLLHTSPDARSLT